MSKFIDVFSQYIGDLKLSKTLLDAEVDGIKIDTKKRTMEYESLSFTACEKK